MVKWLYSYIVILLIFLAYSSFVFSAVKINEIYPAPATGEKEWIELYNDENTGIGISGYYLTDLAQNKIYLEKESIDANGFVIGSCSNILNNTGDTVYLRNNFGEVIDTATYSGSFTSEKTYASCPNGSSNWITSNTTTKNYSNESVCPTPSQILTATPQPSPTSQIQTPTLEITPAFSYNNIYLSEVMVYPESGSHEWIELYNDNDFSVDLTNWYFDDMEGQGSTPKKFSLTIAPKSYGVYELTSSIFNNEGDSIRLLDFNNNLKDSFEYKGGIKNKTWGRADLANDNFCQQEESRGKENTGCINSLTPTRALTATQEPTVATAKLPIADSKLLIANSTKSYLSSPINNQQLTINNSGPSVLGSSTSNPKPIHKKNNSAVKALSFFSLSYSLLTIGGIFARMKFV